MRYTFFRVYSSRSSAIHFSFIRRYRLYVDISWSQSVPMNNNVKMFLYYLVFLDIYIFFKRCCGMSVASENIYCPFLSKSCEHFSSDKMQIPFNPLRTAQFWRSPEYGIIYIIVMIGEILATMKHKNWREKSRSPKLTN